MCFSKSNPWRGPKFEDGTNLWTNLTNSRCLSIKRAEKQVIGPGFNPSYPLLRPYGLQVTTPFRTSRSAPFSKLAVPKMFVCFREISPNPWWFQWRFFFQTVTLENCGKDPISNACFFSQIGGKKPSSRYARVMVPWFQHVPTSTKNQIRYWWQSMGTLVINKKGETVMQIPFFFVEQVGNRRNRSLSSWLGAWCYMIRSRSSSSVVELVVVVVV